MRVQDDGVTEDGAAFLVMELLEGETLEDRRDRLGGRLPAAEVLAFAEQLLQVLEAAHARGVVHRDLKPDNLFLTMEGELKVLDFGIAHLRQADHADSGGTSVGTFMGTPSFMPPEQARARWDLVDARSDLWAVGAVMFTLLSGHLVHEAETISEQLVLAVQTPAPRLRSLVEDVLEYVGAIVDKALSYEKEHRFQNAREMAVAVRQAAPTPDRRARLTSPCEPNPRTPASLTRASIGSVTPCSRRRIAIRAPPRVTPRRSQGSGSRRPLHAPELVAITSLEAAKLRPRGGPLLTGRAGARRESLAKPRAGCGTAPYCRSRAGDCPGNARAERELRPYLGERRHASHSATEFPLLFGHDDSRPQGARPAGGTTRHRTVIFRSARGTRRFEEVGQQPLRQALLTGKDPG